MRRIALVGLLASLSAIDCGTPDGIEYSGSPLSVTVGTHRAIGSYACPGGTTTFQTSTMVYISGTIAPGRWLMSLSKDPNPIRGGVTLDVGGLPIESADNGSVVYTTALSTVYVHRIPSIPFPIIYEYGHDESLPPYAMQFLQADAAHPYGQVVLALYPQGASNPLFGECADLVVAYLTLQP